MEENKKQSTALVLRSHYDETARIFLDAAFPNRASITKLSDSTVMQILQVSGRWGWKVETLAKRMNKALSTEFACQLYLSAALCYRLLPESFAKILAEYPGIKTLGLHIIEHPGNLVTSQFYNLEQYLALVLGLSDKRTLDFRIGLGYKDLAFLCATLKEDVYAIIDGLLESSEIIYDGLGWNYRHEDEAVNSLLRFLAFCIRKDESLVLIALEPELFFQDPRVLKLQDAYFEKERGK